MTQFTIDEQFGARVREARRAAGLTPRDLGTLIGETHQTVHALECGRIPFRMDHLYRIADVLGRPIEFFLRDLPGFVGERAKGDEAFNALGSSFDDPAPRCLDLPALDLAVDATTL